MSNWFHRWLNPHCPDCILICESCEVLKGQLEILNYTNKQLMDRILNPPVPVTIPEPAQREVSIPKNIPWGVRRQMLEAEDRERAKLMKNAPVPVLTEDLEKEMDIVAKEREG